MLGCFLVLFVRSLGEPRAPSYVIHDACLNGRSRVDRQTYAVLAHLTQHYHIQIVFAPQFGDIPQFMEVMFSVLPTESGFLPPQIPEAYFY